VQTCVLDSKAFDDSPDAFLLNKMIDISQFGGMTIFLGALGSAFVGFLSAIGFKELITMAAARYWKRQDHDEEIAVTNDGERIKAQVSLVDQFLERITNLEKEVKELRVDQMSLTKTNVRLETENEHLQETNRKQAQQIQLQALEIQSLRLALDDMNRRFNDLSQRVSANSGQIEASEKSERQALRLKRDWAPKESVQVVIIDDNKDARELLEVSFGFHDISTKSFESGTSALDWLIENDAAVILLDLALPVLDGLVVAAHIRTNEGLAIGRTPAAIAFYTGQEPDAIVAFNQNKFDIKAVFVKGKDAPETVVNTVIKWLGQ
jgi:CheY-like chemotaxis protein